MKTFSQFIWFYTVNICLSFFIRDIQFISIFSIFHYDMRDNTILKTLEHIFRIFITFVCHRFQNLIRFFFSHSAHGRTKQTVISHLIRHFKIPDQMGCGIYCRLWIIRNCETILILHKSGICICQ